MKLPEFDLAAEMSNNLNISKFAEADKISLALSCLNEAANLLDNMNANASSEAITKIIEKIANRK